MIIRNREDIGKINDDVLNSVLREHFMERERLDKLDRMYRGEHSILKRELANAAPNNRVVCNYAKYISDMAVGYLLGKPISYRAENEDDIREMQRRFNAANMANTDAEIAKDMSIFGKAEELIYMSDDDIPIAKSINIDPRNAFVVYDDTIENRKIFGVYYYPRYDLEGRIREYVINVYTKDKHYKYLCGNIFDRKKTLAEENRIYFCDVPMIEYLNNEEEQGDFEQVTSLIDAYNILQSDRINDVERFVQAILFLKGFCIEDGDGKRLKEERILQAPGDNTDAKWLANSLDQNSLESVRKSIETDIHKFSFVPAMTDENFSGNASGVAMKYKLLGFEQMTGIKERYMEKGIRERLKIITNMINWSNNLRFEDIEIIFTHNLPVNKEEMAEILYKLSSVTDEKILRESALTLISH